MDLEPNVRRGTETLRLYEEDVLHGIVLICEHAWQFASAKARKRYSRYKLNFQEFASHIVNPASTGEGSLIMEATDVLDLIVGVHFIFKGRSFQSSREADAYLANASYGGCMLGGEASKGDLENHIQAFHPQYVWSGNMLRPMDMYEALQYGNNVPLIQFLSAELNEATKLLKRLNKGRKFHSGRDHAASPWVWNSKKGFVLDKAILDTGFHFYSSLLRYLLPNFADCSIKQ